MRVSGMVSTIVSCWWTVPKKRKRLFPTAPLFWPPLIRSRLRKLHPMWIRSLIRRLSPISQIHPLSSVKMSSTPSV